MLLYVFFFNNLIHFTWQNITFPSELCDINKTLERNPSKRSRNLSVEIQTLNFIEYIIMLRSGKGQQ